MFWAGDENCQWTTMDHADCLWESSRSSDQLQKRRGGRTWTCCSVERRLDDIWRTVVDCEWRHLWQSCSFHIISSDWQQPFCCIISVLTSERYEMVLSRISARQKCLYCIYSNNNNSNFDMGLKACQRHIDPGFKHYQSICWCLLYVGAFRQYSRLVVCPR